MPQARKLYFDRFVLDPGNASLTSAGKAVPLTPKVFELLCYLASRAGELRKCSNSCAARGAGWSSLRLVDTLGPRP
jgi:DNA-binding response OmpR family regulator